MSRLQIGPAVLMVPEHAAPRSRPPTWEATPNRPLRSPGWWPRATCFSNSPTNDGRAAGNGTGDQPGDSPPAYDRSVNRLRMGILANDDGTDVCELAIARVGRQKPLREHARGHHRRPRHDPEHWLGWALLVEAGAHSTRGCGRRCLGDEGRRRNYLCASFPAGERAGPLVPSSSHVSSRCCASRGSRHEPAALQGLPSGYRGHRNIFGTISTHASGLVGWDLGRKYDAFMRPIAGPEWLEVLRQKRLLGYNPAPMYKQKLNLRDPAFCLREPAKNSDSPLRQVLPKTPSFFDLMETVANIRNSEFHFESLPTLDKLEHYAKQVTQLAEQADLPLRDEMEAVLTRITQLKAGTLPPPPGVVSSCSKPEGLSN